MSLDHLIRKLNHRRIDFFRAVKLRLMTYVCRLLKTDFLTNQPARPQYLVLRLDDKLGDSVTSTGFLQTLKKSNPDVRVVVVAGPQTVGLYQDLNFIDQVYVSRKGFFSTISLLQKLKKEGNFSAIINTSHILNPRTLFLTAILRAVRKISFGYNDTQIFSDFIEIDFMKEHVTDRYKKALSMLGLKFQSDDLKYVIYLPAQSRKESQSVLSQVKSSGKKWAAVNLFAGGKLRNFNLTTATDLLRMLTIDLQLQVVLLANQGDHRLLQQWGLTEISNVYGWSSLSSLQHNMAFAEAADIVITPDTSWVHLTSALGQKMVAIYRQDRDINEANSVIWAPYSTPFKVVFSKSEPAGPDDINDVDLNEIKAAIVQILDSIE